MAGYGSAFRRRPPGCSDLRGRRCASRCACSGAPVVNLFASTSGTDSDWVVKLIDVFPRNYADRSPRWAATNFPSH